MKRIVFFFVATAAVAILAVALHARSSTPVLAASAGAAIYDTNCSSCHASTGMGAPGAFPPLAGNPDVTAANPAKIIHIVKNGLTGPLKVKGKTYNGTMPAWKSG